jgi:nicotinate-nucleotide adenylyltransferase
MNIGLFFGSFNPVHIGHMALANYMVEFSEINQLWFVISPHSPFKKKESLLADHLRSEMVELAIDDDSRFRICDIEFRMPQPSYTIDTLSYLTEKYPGHTFSLIMGSDGLPTFHKWKNYDQIQSRFHRYIYPRKTEQPIDYSLYPNSSIVADAPLIEISSSFIREAIKEKKNVRFFLPGRVAEFIDQYNLYKK